MTEELETFDFEYANDYDAIEDEVDKLNAVTFGDEVEWQFETPNNENDDTNFIRFPFDEFESNESHMNVESKPSNECDRNDLLGLKGSFFTFESFKSLYKSENERLPNNNRDSDFEIAMSKLELLEAKENKINVGNIQDDVDNEIIYAKNIESPLTELSKYSEILYLEFQDCKKLSNNSQFLNGVVAKHLNLLSKKLSELSLPMDVLAQLNYFRLLTTFVSVDNRVNEIRAKGAADPRFYNSEMANIMNHFVALSPQQQAELATIHPVYSVIFDELRNQISRQIPRIIPGSLHMQSHIQPYSNDQGRFWPTSVESRGSTSVNEGGWVTRSERDWLMKVQTRNLVTDNPYMHDYYYTAMKFREMAVAREAQIVATGQTTIPDPISLLPSPITADQLGAGIDPIKDGMPPQYLPAQFENSLGVLTSCNINTPRQTIQVPPRRRIMLPQTSDNDPYKPVRFKRELLGMIEKLHCTVLRVDEVDKSMAKMLVEQHQSRAVLLQHRSYLLNILMDSVNNNVRFVQMFSVAKGARILASVMAIVSSVQFLQLMRTFFFNCLSVWESEFFSEFESDFRSIIVSRIRKLQKDEVSLLITTFFCNLTSKSFSDKIKLQPLSGFCRSEFGLYVVFTVLDAFFKMSPNDKANVQQLVAVAVRSAESKNIVHRILQEFTVLFPTISEQK